ncbi:Sulfate permease, MFS superfamily [Catalinimonas alkaloidigena]|uniref:Sulfate permease, MFS superfamily n=2 Tax=Catalinimonas alkaloidigena TaxID=1075417 RepID=A0A1G9LML0_9BACT|nr:Sulfate permease, MFS superfamily [Catalinimonas alkaloidigena]
MAGLIPAVIGGLLTTFFRGHPISISGPGNGLIVVTLAGVQALGDDAVHGFRYVLAAFIVAGVLQVLLGALRLGKFGDSFPASVVQGMLAAIGIMIISKQVHVSLGQQSGAASSLGTLIEIPSSLADLNPYTTLIAVAGLAILILHPKVRNSVVRFIPSPMWVLLFAVPLGFLFNFFWARHITWGHYQFKVGPELLIQLPDDLLQSFLLPDFGKVDQPAFWWVVLSVTLVSSLESLLSCKAIERLDPYRRKTHYNRELIGIGVSTVLSGLLGGLPVSTVIARSSVNINHGAATRWANFFHGAFLLVFVLLLGGLIQKVPLAALAAILIFTGYKLTAPKVFAEQSQKGWEQLLVFVITILATLLLGLIGGIGVGIAFTLLVHGLRSNLPYQTFFRYLSSPSIRVVAEQEAALHVKIKGIINFFNLIGLQKQLRKLPLGQEVVADFSHARLIDYTVLETVHQFAEDYTRQGGSFDITGLSIHRTSSSHPFALHVLETHPPRRLTHRQQKLKQAAAVRAWGFDPERNWHVTSLRSFAFFSTRPLEFNRNRLAGTYPTLDTRWEVSDVTFAEGALLAKEEYHATLQVVHVPVRMPAFRLEREGLVDRLRAWTGQRDIDFTEFPTFSSLYYLHGQNEEALRRFFTPTLIRFLEQNDRYYLESNGRALLIFKQVRLSSPKEIMKMLHFSERLAHIICARTAQQVRLQPTPSEG